MKADGIMVVMILAFIQGLLDLMVLPLFYLYKDIVGVSVVQIPIYIGFAMIPWFCKPAFGFMSDQYPICGSRRKSYIIIFTVVELCAIIGLATIANSPVVVMMLNFLQMAGLVTKNVIAGHL